MAGAATPSSRRPAAWLLEAAAWIAILVLAAFLRLPDLAGRGTWDADQGHDMLVLRGLVLDGQIPLLGPPTSIGDFHHGVLYYFLLAPAAFVSRADPVAVSTWIALGGVVAVATTGWLARSIAGPVAGAVAGLLLAISASGVEESIFIWNPNLIALSSSIALAAAWRAHRTGRARWWVVAGAAAVVTMHCHVLGVVLTPVVAALLVLDWRGRRATDPAAARRALRATIAWIAIALLSYVPLLIHEVTNDASEIRGALAFLGGGVGGGAGVSLPARIGIGAVRVLGWPLGGLLTAAPIAVLLASALVVGVVTWRGCGPETASGGPGSAGADERLAVRWLGLGLAWTVVALALIAPSLATVVPGLPNDHYHAFADPMVITSVAVGVAALVRSMPSPTAIVPRAVAVAIVGAIAAFNLATQPPPVAADGGWRAALTAAQRAARSAGPGPMSLVSLPDFKSDEALRMPLESIGVEPVALADDPPPGATVVVLCDQLFRDSVGVDCGGPAEDAKVTAVTADPSREPARVDRFEAAPGRWISVYRVP